MAKTIEVLYDKEPIQKFISSEGWSVNKPATSGVASATLSIANRQGIFNDREIHKIISFRIDDDLIFAGFVEKVEPYFEKDLGSVLRMTAYDFGFQDLQVQYAALVSGINYANLVNANDDPSTTNKAQTPQDFVNELEGVTDFGDIGGIVAEAVGTNPLVPKAINNLGGFLETKYIFHNGGNTHFELLFPALRQRESGFDYLRKICEALTVADHSGLAFGGSADPGHFITQHDFYIEPTDPIAGGEIKVFPRGFNDHSIGNVFGNSTIQAVFKGAGSQQNNVIAGGISGDSIDLKNVLIGLFPPELNVPFSGDDWTENLRQESTNKVEFDAFESSPDGFWETFNVSPPETTIGKQQVVGNTTGRGNFHVQGFGGNSPFLRVKFLAPYFNLFAKAFRSPSQTFILFKYRTDTNAETQILVRIADVNGKAIQKDYFLPNLGIGSAGWKEVRLQMFGDAGTIATGWGGDVGDIDLSKIEAMEFQPKTLGVPALSSVLHVDSLHFEVFNFFSPLIFTFKPSIDFYDIRKLPFEVSAPVSEERAIQLCIAHLKARQSKLHGGMLTVKDTANTEHIQFNTRPGDIISVNDDNRLTWIGKSTVHTPVEGFRVENIEHRITKNEGIISNLKLNSWYGVSIPEGSPDTNFLAWGRLYLPYGIGMQKMLDSRLKAMEKQFASPSIVRRT